MKTYIRGHCPSIKKEELRYALKWACGELLSSRIYNDLTVRLFFKDNVLHENETVHSTVMALDGYKRPRIFRMEMSPKLKRFETFETLFHECVHIKQWAIGEMVELNNFTKFGKEKYRLEEHDYWDLPWEIEAFGRQIGLYVHYADHKVEHKIKF